MSSSSLSSKIIQSISQGIYDESIHNTLEQVYKNNPELLHQIFEKIYNSNVSIQNADQRMALVKYLHKYLKISNDYEHLRQWYDFILQSLNSQYQSVIDCSILLLQDLMIRDSNMRDLLFVKYFASKGENELKTILAFQQVASRDFFTKICDFLSPNDLLLLRTSLELLSNVLSKKGSNIHEIINTDALEKLTGLLLVIMEEDIIINMLTVVIMLIPHILNKLPIYLKRLYMIFERILLCKYKTDNTQNTPSIINEELRILNSNLLNHLFGLFPYSTISFLKGVSSENKIFKEKVINIFQSMNLNPLLIEGDIDSEKSDNRWKGTSRKLILDLLPELQKGLLNPEVHEVPTTTINDDLDVDNYDNIDFENDSNANKKYQTIINVLRNQLSFERHIRRQLQDSISSTKKKLIQFDQLDLDRKSLIYKIELLENEIKQLKKKWKESNEVALEAKEKNRKIHQNLSIELNSLRTEMLKLKNEKEVVTNENRLLKEEIILLKERINENEQELFSLKTNSKYVAPDDMSLFYKRMTNIKEEISVWREHERINQLNREDLEELKDQVNKHEENTQKLKNSLNNMTTKYNNLMNKYEESKDALNALLKENKELKMNCETLKNQLNLQKIIEKEKIDSLKEKYNTIKEIVISLEKSIFEKKNCSQCFKLI